MSDGLILPYAWTRQPEGPVRINRDNPLATGLSFLALPGRVMEPCLGDDPEVLVRGDVASQFDSAHIEGRSLSGTSSRSHYPVRTSQWSGTTRYTLLCVARQVAVARRGDCLQIGNTSLGGSPQATLALNSSRTGANSSGRLSFFEFSGTFRVSVDTNSTSIVDGQTHVFVGRRDGSSPSVFVDGIKPAQTVGTSTTTTTTFDDRIYVNGTQANGTSQIDHVFLTAAWTRPLSDEEIFRVSRNPWQLFAPLHRRIYFEAPSANAGAFSSSGVATVTAQSGSIANSNGVGAVSAQSGSIASSNGVGAVSAQSGAIFASTGAADVLAQAGFIASIAGVGELLAQSGSIASSAGTANVEFSSQEGVSSFSIAGAANVIAQSGGIFVSVGLADFVAQSGSQSAMAGTSQAIFGSGSTALSTGSAVTAFVSQAIDSKAFLIQGVAQVDFQAVPTGLTSNFSASGRTHLDFFSQLFPPVEIRGGKDHLPALRTE